ncbi:hypothetical protein [Cellulomonas sp. S1-8]|uniref:hypothetical protein n=1 Tax=Cellulomonas sp. S1-8 TaxID=2904790 RepID=UPI002243B985|nr:hypothetical protein [Cellulomonas sp. S1-8]UZN04136.1 hypothetical protein OKX07_04145 [Cellulomonas sp. S1-8]
MIFSPVLITWVLIGLAANLPAAFGGSPSVTHILVSLAGLTHSLVGFWRDGGRNITVPAIFFFATGLFVFFPGLAIALGGAGLRHGPLAMLSALNYWYFTQLALHHLVWENRPIKDHRAVIVASPRVLRWAQVVGVMLAATGTAASVTGVGEQLLASGVAFTGVVLLSTATFAAPSRVSPAGYVLVAAAGLAYAQFVFTGFGRLQLGALGLAMAITLAHRFRGRGVKALILLTSAPALAYLARSRVSFAAETTSASAAQRETGLESVFSPLIRFAELWHMNASGGLDHSYLRTFWAALVAMVPRELWPDKPIGLGAELAMIFRPEYAAYGHSELALLSGEFLLAAGLVGLLVMPVALAWLVLRLDRMLSGSSASGFDTRGHLLQAVAVVILSASIVDLVWGGTFAYSSRVGPRLLVVGVLFVAFAWHRGSHEPTAMAAVAPRNRAGAGVGVGANRPAQLPAGGRPSTRMR